MARSDARLVAGAVVAVPMIMIWTRRLLLATSLSLIACAGAPTRSDDGAPRIKDSAPEKIAAQRAASPGLALEAEDDRWGLTAAAERRRAQDERKAKAPVPGASRIDLVPSRPEQR
jgi:hypothetical protein